MLFYVDPEGPSIQASEKWIRLGDDLLWNHVDRAYVQGEGSADKPLKTMALFASEQIYPQPDADTFLRQDCLPYIWSGC